MTESYRKDICENKYFRPNEKFFLNRIEEEKIPHMHSHEDCVEIAYVSSGQGLHKIGEQEFSVHKGDIFIINGNIPHVFFYDKTKKYEPLVVCNCLFTLDFIDYNLTNTNNFFELSNNYFLRELFPRDQNVELIKILNHENSDIEEIFEKMLREYFLQEQGYKEVIRAYIIELLVKVLRLYGNESDMSEKINYRNKKVIDNSINYMKAYYNRKLSLESVASMFGYSSNYFSKLFQKNMRISFIDYIQKYRVEVACTLLRKDETTTISEIASNVGYTDVKFFKVVFTRITGKTPSEYRKTIQ
ncbi:MAG: helix-turn-helix transcriptional regulator [Vallitaleaceae bacterium]|nr:helix-turn-helix transcriptional regulator [Vallitaleaceae bacterium]